MGASCQQVMLGLVAESMRCLLGHSDGGGSVPFGPQISEGPPQGGRCFRHGLGIEPGPRGQQEGDDPLTSGFQMCWASLLLLEMKVFP